MRQRWRDSGPPKSAIWFAIEAAIIVLAVVGGFAYWLSCSIVE